MRLKAAFKEENYVISSERCSIFEVATIAMREKRREYEG
jgi:hypothetical protein